MFKKTCYSCGAKVDKLVDGICEECLQEQRPPIKEVKPVVFKYCNMSKRIKYKNYFYTHKKIEEMMPDIMKKQVVIDDAYSLNKLKIKNFKVDGNRINFDINVDCDMK